MSNLKYDKETSNLGGISEFKFIYEEDLPGTIESINGLAINFNPNYDFIVPDIIPETSSFTETKIEADLFQYEFTSFVAKDEIDKLNAGTKLDNKKIIAAVFDNNNKLRVLGQKGNGCILNINFDKGVKVSDRNAYELKLSWKSTKRSFFAPSESATFECVLIDHSTHAVQAVPYQITLRITRTDSESSASGSGSFVIDWGDDNTQSYSVFLAPGESVDIVANGVLPKLDNLTISWSGVCSGELSLNPYRTLDIETDQTTSSFAGIRSLTTNGSSFYCYIVELDTFFNLVPGVFSTYAFPGGIYNLKIFGNWSVVTRLDLRSNNIINRFSDDNNALARNTELFIDRNNIKEIEFHTPFLTNILEWNAFAVNQLGNTGLQSLNIEGCTNCPGWKTKMPNTLTYYNIINSGARYICIDNVTQLQSIEGIENTPLIELSANGATSFTFNFNSGAYLSTIKTLSLQGTAENHINLSLFTALEQYNRNRYAQGYNVKQFTPPNNKAKIKTIWLSYNSLSSLVVNGYNALTEIEFNYGLNGGVINLSNNPNLALGPETRYWFMYCKPQSIDFSNTKINQFNQRSQLLTGLNAINIQGTTPSYVNVVGGSLNQTFIDSIIQVCVNGNVSNGFLKTDGGTNATPSTTGQANINTLRARGWTITVTGGY